jgi:hypothetical protein
MNRVRSRCAGPVEMRGWARERVRSNRVHSGGETAVAYAIALSGRDRVHAARGERVAVYGIALEERTRVQSAVPDARVYAFEPAAVVEATYRPHGAVVAA